MFSIGRKIRLSIFGQSHSQAIGGVLDGIPAGMRLDMDGIQSFMARRAPGRDLTTPRKEADIPVILSGTVDDVTCGAPLAFMIGNTNTRSKDYSNLRDVPRPMHSDYAASVRFNGFNDIRGGGQFSGRLTAPLCFAGAIALQALDARGITVGAHIAAIADVEDDRFDPVSVSAVQLRKLRLMMTPIQSDSAAASMRERVAVARADEDSVGGVIECAAVGLPAGLGDPMFDGVENLLARALFGIPAVKGVEFGAGFAVAKLRGSEHNDGFRVDENGEIRTVTNRHGGILGGITTGMPLLFRLAIKPTPSIGIEQDSVSLSKLENVKLKVEGRHDPCIVMRACPPVEAVTALVLWDLIACAGL